MKIGECPTILLLSITVATCVAFLSPASAQQEASYRVYVEPLPDWAGYASTVIYDATNVWEKANPNLHFYKADTPQQADLYIQWIRDYGDVRYRLGETIHGDVIQVGLGDSYCLGKWQPYSSSTVTRIAEHEIGHFLGLGHSTDPNDLMYHSTQVQYGIVEIEKNLAEGYDWFVPVCTTKDVTSYDYQVTTNDPTYGFDVYFVPSKNEHYQYSKGQQFQYYSGDGCFAKGYLSFSGTCRVAKGSGLVISMPQQLTNPLVTITVKLEEKTLTTTESQTSNSILPQQSPTPTPTTGFVKVDQNQFVLPNYQSVEVNVYGKIDEPRGGKVVLIITNPYGTAETRETFVTSDGDFSTPIILDKYSPIGLYQIYASYQNSDLGSTSFNVIGKDTLPDQTAPQQQTQIPPSENEINVVGTDFSLTYGIIGGKVLGIEADTETKSLLTSIQATSGGTLIITLPRALIDAKFPNGNDDRFFVLIDGREETFDETTAFAERTLTIDFPNGAETIEIIGTQTVPEFGPMAALILAIAIISIITFSTKMELKLKI